MAFILNVRKVAGSKRLCAILTSCPQKRSIHFNLSAEQLEIKTLAKKFTEEHIIPKAVHHDSTGEFPMEILKKAWSLGLLNNHISKDYGGLGLSSMDGVLIAEEMAYGCAGIWTAAEANNLAQAPLIIQGNEEQKRKYLTRMTEAPLLAAYCVTEPSAGSDVAGIQTKARKCGKEWVINGSKMWITNGSVANWYFVLARTDLDTEKEGCSSHKADTSKALSAFIVEKEAPGSQGRLIIGKKEDMMGQRASDTRCITFQDVIIPDSQRIGEIGQGFKLAMKAFDSTRPAIGAGAVGLSKRALYEATNYALNRSFMSQPIAHHQSIANLLAEMSLNVHASRFLVWKAATEFDSQQRNSYYASMAKLSASQTATKCASYAVQIFGGLGYNKESPVEKLYRDAKLFEIYEGTTQIQKLVISKLLFEKIIKTSDDY